LEATATSFEGIEQLMAGQVLEDFGEEMLRNLNVVSDISAQRWAVRVRRQMDQCADGVFTGLREEHMHSCEREFRSD